MLRKTPAWVWDAASFAEHGHLVGIVTALLTPLASCRRIVDDSQIIGCCMAGIVGAGSSDQRAARDGAPAGMDGTD